MPKKTMLRGLAFGDVHLSTEDQPHWSWVEFKKFMKAYSPDFTIDLGDFISWGMISHFNRGVFRKLEARRISHEYDLANRELDQVLKSSPCHTMLQGNHDVWVEEYVDLHPEVEGMVEYRQNLGLAERKIDYIELPDQPKDFGKLAVLHGWWAPQRPAKKHLDAIGKSVLHGHVHRFDHAVNVNFSTREVIQGWSVGCLCDTRPTYQRARPTQHANGFAQVWWDPKSGDFDVKPVIMHSGLYIVDGVRYSMKEAVTDAG